MSVVRARLRVVPERGSENSSRRVAVYLSIAIVAIGATWATWIVTDYFFSNFSSDRRARELSEQLADDWERDRADSVPSAVSTPLSINDNFDVSSPALGDPFARLYIPRLRGDVWGTPIIHGVKQEQLNQGVGHYPNSALPGVDGNFSLFGHRSGNGQPLAHIERLVKGDEVIVRTRDHWFVYTLRREKIVPGEAFGVTSNAPLLALEIPAANRYRVITLITCEPRWSTDNRWVWWGVLSAVYPAQSPPLVISASRTPND